MTYAADIDWAGMLGRDTFGQPVTFTRADGTATTITAIVDENGGRVQLLAGAAVQTDEPNVAVRIADLGYLPQPTDVVEIAGRAYRVNETRPDSEGHARVFLHRLGNVPPAPRPYARAA